MRGQDYELTWKVRRCFKLLGAMADGYLVPYGITAPERAALEFIDSWGPMSVPELARSFLVTRQNIQVRVNALIRKGLLEKKPNPAHARSSLLVMTKAGNRLFSQIKQAETTLIGDVFEGISPDEIESASQTLSHLIDNISTKLEPSPDQTTDMIKG